SRVHGLPSSAQAAVLLAKTQPVAGSQPSVVQGFPSSHTGGAPAVQLPARHVSAPLHASPSLHDVPSGLAGCVAARPSETSRVHGLPSSAHGLVFAVKTQPVVGLHVSVVHALSSSHASGVPAVQLPAWHVSAPLQALPSLHGVSFVFARWV